MISNSQPSVGHDWPAADELRFDAGVRLRTDHLFGRLADVIPEAEWPLHAPLIDAINRLKAERNAVILAHNYMTPEIFHCVGDATGDSLKLAQLAAQGRGHLSRRSHTLRRRRRRQRRPRVKWRAWQLSCMRN